MRRFFILFMLVLISSTISAQVSLIEIKTEEVLESFPQYGQIHSIHVKNNHIFFSNATKCTIIDLEDYSFEVVDPDIDLFRIYGEYNDNLFVVSRGSNTNHQFERDLFQYNPQTLEMSVFNFYPVIPTREDYFNQYINNQFFRTINEGQGGFITVLEDYDSEERVGVFPGVLCDLTADRYHSLWARQSELKIYDHLNKKWIDLSIKESIPDFMIPSIYFINNELFLFQTSITHDIYSIFNLKGEEVLKLKYTAPKSYENSLSFEKIEDCEYGVYGLRNHLVKTIGEAQVLHDFGLLFQETTGRANDSRVRIREYPLLDAQHLAYLSAGDELEILDRSGVKVVIDDMEEYWYKIRRLSDGQEGWSYGAFIDVDEPPPREDADEPRLYRILDFDPSEPPDGP